MSPNHIPGNEPYAGDISTEPGIGLHFKPQDKR